MKNKNQDEKQWKWAKRNILKIYRRIQTKSPNPYSFGHLGIFVVFCDVVLFFVFSCVTSFIEEVIVSFLLSQFFPPLFVPRNAKFSHYPSLGLLPSWDKLLCVVCCAVDVVLLLMMEFLNLVLSFNSSFPVPLLLIILCLLLLVLLL